MAKNKDISHGNGDDLSERENSGKDPGMEQSGPVFYLRLFVSGNSSRSEQAIQNIRQICEQYLPDRYELEVIDVTQYPEKTREYQILALPTLLKELPEPLRKVVGDLSEKEKVLEGLDIKWLK